MSSMNASPPGPSVFLKEAPLARVLVQIRWPELSNFDLDSVAASMAHELGDVYPLKRRDAEVQVTFGPTGPQQQLNGFVHRFTSALEDWTVAVGESFLAIETNAYQGHDDFISRLRDALLKLAGAAAIPVVSRVGYRYTNRIVGDRDRAHLSEWFVPSVLGGIGDTPSGSELVHSITESVYRLQSDFLLVRSAQVAPNESIDPTLLPLPETSWILDLDAYDESRRQFDPDAVAERAQELSRLASNHFRTLTTTEFVERHS